MALAWWLDEEPAPGLEREHIGRGERRALHELAADDVRNVAEHVHLLRPAQHARLVRIRHDRVPAREDGITAGEHVPARMHAVDGLRGRPERRHRLAVTRVDRGVARLVRREDMLRRLVLRHPL